MRIPVGGRTVPMTVFVVLGIWRSPWGAHEQRPFFLSTALFLLGFGGLVTSVWPYMVPRNASV
jgi:cytochrome d ubiquinol oxidase subunit II